MQATYEQAQLNNSATFVEMLDILVKIVPREMSFTFNTTFNFNTRRIQLRF